MVLVGDGGSTKTEWVVVDPERGPIKRFRTKGINPYFYTFAELIEELKQAVVPETVGIALTKVLFYAAGCGNPSSTKILTEAFEACYGSSIETHVGSDMLGAAIALWQNEDGIAAILGTGANSCVYQNQGIVKNVASLGYILSDWGSGAVLGRDLLSEMLTHKMDPKLIEAFYDKYEINKLDVLDRIYHQSKPNKYLASFTPFLKENSFHPQCQAILEDNFNKFFDYYILKYSEVENLKIRLAGSIAFHFSEQIETIAVQKGVEIDKVMQSPIDGLIDYTVDKSTVL
ncbi:N-acetylglucosamine kinase [Sediminitomix flava]|uniref:N-acetylglucosamine kinase-like BadF-type ATPase n=1 Tax=Sediminitomix flava TaxID=379075 RepID=A0A315ZHV4_SEDFL|nr:N-acetylglucosamine kinase [Sediminitomix flava]PWJ44398.1 N-acetylglucosamine kinase-like BadF-type ATPase [Sediminitomix flava]